MSDDEIEDRACTWLLAHVRSHLTIHESSYDLGDDWAHEFDDYANMKLWVAQFVDVLYQILADIFNTDVFLTQEGDPRLSDNARMTPCHRNALTTMIHLIRDHLGSHIDLWYTPAYTPAYTYTHTYIHTHAHTHTH